MQVTEWCLVAKAVQTSDLDYAGKPRESPPNSSALYKPHTPDDPLDKAA